MGSNAPSAAKPSKSIFDPFNSSATGHQRPENGFTNSAPWRESRSKKLREQFAADAGGGKRVNDTVGAGSLDFGHDGRTANGGWERGAQGLRARGQRSLWESMGMLEPSSTLVPSDNDLLARPEDRVTRERTAVVNPYTPFRHANGRVRESSWTAHEISPSELLEPVSPAVENPNDNIASPATCNAVAESDGRSDLAQLSKCPQIFAGLTFYINGSTAPLSDHQVKRLLSSHGGRVSVALGRRTVTHVILGRPNSSGGSGGGLAGSKIQKEVTRIGGKGVKFVTADWITESVKAGRRLPESRFEALKLAPKGVNSVASMFKR